MTHINDILTQRGIPAPPLRVGHLITITHTCGTTTAMVEQEHLRRNAVHLPLYKPRQILFHRWNRPAEGVDYSVRFDMIR